MATPWLQMKPWFWGNAKNSNCSPIWTCHTRSPCLEWNCYGHAVRNWNFQNYKIMISQCINPFPGHPPPEKLWLNKKKCQSPKSPRLLLLCYEKICGIRPVRRFQFQMLCQRWKQHKHEHISIWNRKQQTGPIPQIFSKHNSSKTLLGLL